MVTRKLNTLRDWIDCLGGTVLAGHAYEISAQAISNWLADGKIPWGRYPRTVVLARRRHVEVRQVWFEQVSMPKKREKHAGGARGTNGPGKGATR